ncbi:MAG: hypothetical protein ACLKAO_12910 [Alkaliphilus sp.]
MELKIDDCRNIFDIYLRLFTVLKYNEGNIATIEDKLSINKDLKIAESGYLSSIDSLLEKEFFDACLSPKNKSDLLALIPAEDKERRLLFLLILFCKIDELFGVQSDGVNKYIYTKSNDYENDGARAVEVEPLNSIDTLSQGKVYYRKASFVEQNFSADEFPRRSNKTGSCIERHQNNLLVAYEQKTDIKVNLYKINCERTLKIIDKARNNLKIALVPFTDDQEYIKFKAVGSTFEVESLSNEDNYAKKAIDILKKLKSENINIVVFPEFMFSSKILHDVRKYLRNEENQFAMIVFGSIWENQNNKCYVLSGKGNKLAFQSKLNKFHKSNDFIKFGNNEGIKTNSENRIINIYDVDNLGRINTPVCVDFISDNYFNRLLAMGVNVCFNPAYTKSLKAFANYAEKIGSHNYGSVFLSNCCIPVKQKNSKNAESESCQESQEQRLHRILFGYIPIKSVKFKHICICSEKANICCANEEKFCYLLIKFGLSSCTMVPVHL